MHQLARTGRLMHYHRSLLQIVAGISHVVMFTKNVVQASYHAGNCTSIKLFSMTDMFTEHVPKPSVHCAWVHWK